MIHTHIPHPKIVQFLDMVTEQVDDLSTNIGHVEHQSSSPGLFNDKDINAFHHLEDPSHGRCLSGFSGLIRGIVKLFWDIGNKAD